jgi:hypothetical protein
MPLLWTRFAFNGVHTMQSHHYRLLHKWLSLSNDLPLSVHLAGLPQSLNDYSRLRGRRRIERRQLEERAMNAVKELLVYSERWYELSLRGWPWMLVVEKLPRLIRLEITPTSSPASVDEPALRPRVLWTALGLYSILLSRAASYRAFESLAGFPWSQLSEIDMYVETRRELEALVTSCCHNA